MKIQLIPTIDRIQIVDILLNENLGNKIIGLDVIGSPDQLNLDKWSFLIPKINDQPTGIVMFDNIDYKTYNVHFGIYRKYYGLAEVIGNFFLNCVAPIQFHGATFLAPTINSLSRRLAKKLNFVEIEKNLYKYEVK